MKFFKLLKSLKTYLINQKSDMCVRCKEGCLRRTFALNDGLTKQIMCIGVFFKKSFLKMPLCFVLLLALITTGCGSTALQDSSVSDNSDVSDKNLSLYEQSENQLYLDASADENPQKIQSSTYEPLNYDYQKSIWLPVFSYKNLMLDKSEDEFRSNIRKYLSDAKSQGYNTIYAHSRAYSDAYYDSSIFPKGEFYNGKYDPLAIMLDEAHKLKLSVHAWINPLRCLTVEEMKNVSDNFIVRKWADQKSDSYIRAVDGRFFLNPAYDEVISLISDGVKEIVSNYNVDGIHIDDYFYPTTSPDFDNQAFAQSGQNDLSKWRINNCNKLVKSIYDTIKSVNPKVLFGISPQGNITSDYASQYADVKLWAGTCGYCDYIVPQIYFGFNNQSCPFNDVLAQWESITVCDNVSLVIGLAAYKLGKEDKWAGSGSQEWIENSDIITRQIQAVEKSSAKGYAVFY